VLKVFYNRCGYYGVERAYNSTRSVTQGLYVHPKVKKVLFKKSFVFLGPKVYNLLPNYIKCNSINEKQFLLKLKKWLFTKETVADLIMVLA
jgi:hypothetical protein